MDDLTAFERQLAGEVRRAYGPERPIDVAAVVRGASTAPRRVGLPSFRDPRRLAVVGVAAALMIAVVASGVLTPDQANEVAPQVGTPETSDTELLPGVELELRTVGTGVHRVEGDGIRRLEQGVRDLAVTPDGGVWVIRYGEVTEKDGPDRVVPEGLARNVRVVRLGERGAAATAEQELDFPMSFVETSPGESMLVRPRLEDGATTPGTTSHPLDVLAFDGSGWTELTGAGVEACFSEAVARPSSGLEGGELDGMLLSDGTCWVSVRGDGGITKRARQQDGNDSPRRGGLDAPAVWRIDADGTEQVFTYRDIGLDGTSEVGWSWAVGDDGTVWATYGDWDSDVPIGLVAFDGAEWTVVPGAPGTGRPGFGWRQGLVVAPDGVVWLHANDDRGVAVWLHGWDGSAWKTRPTDLESGGRGYRGRGIDIDPQGRIWVGGLALSREEGVQRIPFFRYHGRTTPPTPPGIHLDALHHAQNGTTWVLQDGRFYAVDIDVALEAAEVADG